MKIASGTQFHVYYLLWGQRLLHDCENRLWNRWSTIHNTSVEVQEVRTLTLEIRVTAHLHLKLRLLILWIFGKSW